jgi:hypothetical protein
MRRRSLITTTPAWLRKLAQSKMRLRLKRLWFRLRFAWYLWHQVKYDGTGHKIQWWAALPWAWDLAWWGIDPRTLEAQFDYHGEDYAQNNTP